MREVRRRSSVKSPSCVRKTRGRPLSIVSSDDTPEKQETENDSECANQNDRRPSLSRNRSPIRTRSFSGHLPGPPRKLSKATELVSLAAEPRSEKDEDNSQYDDEMGERVEKVTSHGCIPPAVEAKNGDEDYHTKLRTRSARQSVAELVVPAATKKTPDASSKVVSPKRPRSSVKRRSSTIARQPTSPTFSPPTKRQTAGRERESVPKTSRTGSRVHVAWTTDEARGTSSAKSATSRLALWAASVPPSIDLGAQLWKREMQLYRWRNPMQVIPGFRSSASSNPPSPVTSYLYHQGYLDPEESAPVVSQAIPEPPEPFGNVLLDNHFLSASFIPKAEEDAYKAAESDFLLGVTVPWSSRHTSGYLVPTNGSNNSTSTPNVLPWTASNPFHGGISRSDIVHMRQQQQQQHLQPPQQQQPQQQQHLQPTQPQQPQQQLRSPSQSQFLMPSPQPSPRFHSTSPIAYTTALPHPHTNTSPLLGSTPPPASSSRLVVPSGVPTIAVTPSHQTTLLSQRFRNRPHTFPYIHTPEGSLWNLIPAQELFRKLHILTGESYGSDTASEASMSALGLSSPVPRMLMGGESMVSPALLDISAIDSPVPRRRARKSASVYRPPTPHPHHATSLTTIKSEL
ncbi:hypothetical protein DFS34DRAFT_603621 [Phlyctochytrium arcticum]|nr:hypothetical protein DFS34DRAFT_603621 [Phlyctochytrium arcticum]